MKPQTETMISVRDCADRLGVSKSLIYALCKSDRLLHERHGLGRGVIRVSETSLDDYRRSAVRPRSGSADGNGTITNTEKGKNES